MDTIKDELVKELENELPILPDEGNWVIHCDADKVADFIRSRERIMMQRVLEALKPCKPSYYKDQWHINVDQAISICKEYL